MAGKVRAIKPVEPRKATPRRKGKLAAKALKARAAELALAASPAQYLGLKQSSGSLRLSRLVTDGLECDAVEALATHLELSAADFTANYLHLPKQTLARRKADGKLTTAESDRVVRYARLFKQAVDMLEGDGAAALRWLKSPQAVLANQTPLQFARTESGALEVHQLIGRIEAGVYS